MSDTVFDDEVKKWKPRNKQAALVVRRASEALLHTPPPKTKPTFAPTQQQRVEVYCATLRRNIEAAEGWKRNRLPRKERKRLQRLEYAEAQRRRYLAYRLGI